jgi:hypothetical protein
MNKGTLISFDLIVEQNIHEVYDCSLDTALSVELSSLKTAIYGTGLEIWELKQARLLEWINTPKRKTKLHKVDEVRQMRQTVVLVLANKLTKNQCYDIINGNYKPKRLDFYKTNLNSN